MEIADYPQARQLMLDRFSREEQTQPHLRLFRAILERLPTVGAEIPREELLTMVRDGTGLSGGKANSLEEFGRIAQHIAGALNLEPEHRISQEKWTIAVNPRGAMKCYRGTEEIEEDIRTEISKTVSNFRKLLRNLELTERQIEVVSQIYQDTLSVFYGVLEEENQKGSA